ncbi:MAG: hypothetical protein ACR2IF_06670 [Terriglobales bacterium]
MKKIAKLRIEESTVDRGLPESPFSVTHGIFRRRRGGVTFVAEQANW